MGTGLLVIVVLVVGAAAGVGGWAALRARSAQEASERRLREEQAVAVRREAELRVELERARAAAGDEDRMVDAFRSLSAQVLATQGEQLVQLAEARYGALQERTDAVLSGHGQAVNHNLQQLADRLASLERERLTATVELRTLVQDLSRATTATREETAKLASAMRDNRVRGAWGEVQLRRALELAGLSRNIDFVEQRGVSDADGAGRPDVVVPLANGRCVVIDAKVPLDHYLRAADADDPAEERDLQVRHARAVGEHVKSLAARDYVAKVDGSVDLVLMFLPGEPFLAAALDADPTLFESAAAKGVHLVTPSSLVPVLRGIALGWREHQAEQAAAEIHALGVELHERIALFAEHFAKVGSTLDRTVEAYNRSVGSLDTRLLSTARKLSERGARSNKEVPAVEHVETTARRLRVLTTPVAEELVGPTPTTGELPAPVEVPA